MSNIWNKQTAEDKEKILKRIDFHMGAAAKHAEIAEIYAKRGGLTRALLYTGAGSSWYPKSLVRKISYCAERIHAIRLRREAGVDTWVDQNRNIT